MSVETAVAKCAYHHNLLPSTVIVPRFTLGYQSSLRQSATVFATIIGGEQVHLFRKNFKVGTAQHLLFWV